MAPCRALSVEKVEAGTSIVKDAGVTMTDIVDSSQQVKALLAHIAHGAAEQAQGVALIDESFHRLEETTQRNAALVEQTAAATGSLRDQAHGLAQQVSRFRLPAV